MASPTPKPITAEQSSAPSRFDQFVSRRLEQAGTQVKWIDLASSLILVLTVVLGVLLMACVVDGWLLPLGRFTRILLLVGLLTYIAVVVFRAVVPLLGHRINPAYAARMIEQSEPTFKNSLLNYVFLRGHRRAESGAIIQAVQEKAAQDLSRVSLDSAIDRSRLIQIGFALVAVTLIGGLYKLLSPKDPFATIARVAAPLSDIQAPSRVRIMSVEPGSVDVFFGDTVSVTADIRGAGSQTPVALMYSTTDGQRSNVTIPLEADSFGHRYNGVLTTTDAGIQHSLQYWIVAGDGRSAEYSVSVRPSPTITVERIELTPPAYTELPSLQLAGRGDIDAIEGTRVRLSAVTNLPIASATLELLHAVSQTNEIPDGASPAPPAPATEYSVVERLPMSSAERQATAEFQLLRSGTAQKFTHYRLQFTTPDGQSNRVSPAYAVKISPDIAPELEVLEPSVQQLQVPQNGAQSIRVRALDPDFRITAIRLIALHQGRVVLEQNLPLDQPSGVGNVQSNFRLRPDAIPLQVGDKLIFHLLAKDNRHSPLSDQLDPNVTRSGNFELTVTDPVQPSADQNRSGENDSGEGSNAGSDPTENQQGESDPSQPSPGEQPSDPSAGEKMDDGDSGSSSGESQSSEQPSGEGEKGDSSSGGGNQAQPSGEQNSSEGGMQGDSSQSGDAQPSDPSAGEDSASSGDRQGNASERGGDPTSDSGNPSGTDSTGAGQEGAAGESGNPAQPNDPGQRMKSSAGDGAAPDDNAQRSPASQPESNDSGTRGDGTRREPGDNSGNSENGAQAGNPSARPQTDRPLDEQSTDGERFEKLLERMNQQSQASPSGQNQPSSQPSAQPQNNSESGGDSSADRPGADPTRSPNGDPRNQAGGDPKSDPTGRPETGGNHETQPPGGNSDSESSEPKSDPAGAGDRGDAAGNQQPDGQSNSERPSSANSGEGAQGDSGAENRTNPSMTDDPSQPDAGSESRGDQRNDSGAEGSRVDGTRPQDGSESPETDADGRSEGDASQQAPRGSDPRRQQTDQTQYPDSSQSMTDVFNPPPETTEEKEQLERSREATDLVLDYLKDQAHRPNSDLLNEMNWTDEELRAFVERWTKLKEDASTGDESAERRYAEALRSLGLRSQVEGARRAVGNRDQLRDLNEDGAVSRPPAKFAEAFRDFSKGRSQSGNRP